MIPVNTLHKLCIILYVKPPYHQPPASCIRNRLSAEGDLSAPMTFTSRRSATNKLDPGWLPAAELIKGFPIIIDGHSLRPPFKKSCLGHRNLDFAWGALNMIVFYDELNPRPHGSTLLGAAAPTMQLLAARPGFLEASRILGVTVEALFT